MSHILFTPYADEISTFSATEMNKPLESFDEALVYMKNIIVTCDGDFLVSSTDGKFSFTGNLRVIFTSPIDGKIIENIVITTMLKMELGDCIFVDLNSVNGSQLLLQKVQLSGNNIMALKSNRLLIAYRNSVTGEISLANTLHKVVNGSGQCLDRIVSLADGIVVSPGQILYLNADGKYGIADNSTIVKTIDLVMVKAVSAKEATIIESGLMTLVCDFNIGDPLYLDVEGKFSTIPPSGSGKIVKCIGYMVAKNVLKFKPDSLGIELL